MNASTRRAIHHVVHLSTHPEQEIVGFLERPTLGFSQITQLDQLGGGGKPLLEVAEPKHALVIAQATHAVLHVGFLHEDTCPVLTAQF
jgi:hypothetical protein